MVFCCGSPRWLIHSCIPSPPLLYTPYFVQAFTSLSPARLPEHSLSSCNPISSGLIPLVPSLLHFSLAFITIWKSIYLLICVFIATQQGEGCLFCSLLHSPCRGQSRCSISVSWMNEVMHPLNQSIAPKLWFSSRHCVRGRDIPGGLGICFLYWMERYQMSGAT